MTTAKKTERNPLVSVIIPTYNAEETLEKCVLSILNQSYSNIEIIIQDDFSNDRTEEIGRNLMLKQKNVFYYRNDSNLGCYKTRNNAIRMSKGRFIAIQDSDDISLQHRIEKQLSYLIDSDYLICLGKIIRSRCKVEELDITNETEMMKLINSRRLLNKKGRYDRVDQVRLGLNTSMFKREVFVHYGLFWEERFSSDAEIVERILAEKKALFFPIKKMNLYEFISKNEFIRNVYLRINDILVISVMMNDNNLTNKYQKKNRETFEKKWRKKLKGKFKYEYPRFLIEEI